jgi:hypothetical protein
VDPVEEEERSVENSAEDDGQLGPILQAVFPVEALFEIEIPVL